MIGRLCFYVLSVLWLLNSCAEEKVEICVPLSSSDTLVVMHWNIGHFSLGQDQNPTFSAGRADTLAPMYANLVDSVMPDLVGVCEWSNAISVKGGDARRAVFGRMRYASVGAKWGYNCNAIFANCSLLKSYDYFFVNSLYNRYARVAEFFVDESPAVFVEAHLDWDYERSTPEYRVAQIRELIALCRPFDHAIVCGDFNVDAELYAQEYDIFCQAGFALANGGFIPYTPTYPASGPTRFLDNVAVRGFDFVSADVRPMPHLSDHCAMVVSLVIR